MKLISVVSGTASLNTQANVVGVAGWGMGDGERKLNRVDYVFRRVWLNGVTFLPCDDLLHK